VAFNRIRAKRKKTMTCPKCKEPLRITASLKNAACTNCQILYAVDYKLTVERKPEKRRTQAQIRASQDRSDRYQRAVRDMIDHVLDKVEQGYYTLQEFINDPTAYFEPEVMGKEYANQFARKSVIKQISVKADGCPW
jgi:CRISPR/Cas system-associated protein Cas10 (large subunit of type III CRISPR-Cas system)